MSVLRDTDLPHAARRFTWFALAAAAMAMLPSTEVAAQGRKRNEARTQSPAAPAAGAPLRREGRGGGPGGGGPGGGWQGGGWQGGGWPGGGGPGGGSSRWLDRDGDGQIEPGEVPDFMRGRLEASLRGAGLDPSRPISIERYDELRQRGGGGPGQSPAAAESPAETPLVPGFGNEFEDTPVATFGEAAEAADAWKHDYEPNVLNQARDIVQRYDTNKNGILERSEWKTVPWSNDPNGSDRNKDGKLSLQEMAERLATQARDGRRLGGPAPGGVTPAIGGANPTGGGNNRRSFGGFASLFGGDAVYRSLDKNGNGKLEASEVEGNTMVQQQIKDASLDLSRGVSIQELVEKRPRGGGGNRPGRGFGQPGGGGFSFGSPGGGGFGAPGGFGAFNVSGTDEAPLDFGEGDSSDDSSSAGSSPSPKRDGRKTGGGRGIGGNPTSAKKDDSTSKSATYRFHTSEELLAKENLPPWFIPKDKNGDGQVSMSEFTTTWNEDEVKRFQAWDGNGDGVITPAEAKGSGKPPVASEDRRPRATSPSTPSPNTTVVAATSGKTPVSETAETESAEETGSTVETPAAPAETKPTPTKAAVSPSALPEDLLAQAQKRVTQLDKDGNGALERGEWPTGGLLPYPQIDANQDAVVTKEEIAAYMLEIRERNK